MDDLLSVLRPFATLGGPLDGSPAFHDLPDDAVVYSNSGASITAGDVRKARESIHLAARDSRAGIMQVQRPAPCWCPYCGEPHSPQVQETNPRITDSANPPQFSTEEK